ncbi:MULTISPECIES: M23 family metallopeptidase [Flavobacterium]|uniref:Peptidoglycan DD-metalloendopeptidase family protein n=1 Tax=Flavobacterium jumunjinense TaxID=998845 RepID=A0ABV5GIN2_9FLAO|nr:MULTISPECIES: peptidoglycan DD-metalloendopeptidase family protein [Flavobacterium]
MKYLPLLFLSLFLFISCNDVKEKEVKKPKVKVNTEPIVKEYGFVFNDYKVIRDTIKSGDNLSLIFGKFDLPDSLRTFDAVEKVKDSFNPRMIKIGKPYLLFLDKKKPNELNALVYVKNKIEYAVIDFRDSVQVNNKKKPTSLKRRTIAAEIEGSLSETLSKQGVSQAFATKLAKVYEYSIDFFKIQKGDKFSVTINERYIEDSIYVGIESVESTYFQHRGNDYYAFPYKLKPEQAYPDYYDEKGNGLKSMFLKSPLDYFRISSRFSGRRFHPVQKRWKAHNGTDYAAAHGTPIKATATGVVERAGYTSGNGNYVKIRHNGTYSTQYLHMSKILVKNGQHVSQGQVIGKVGSTGLATGPHVCYRFWKNGVQVDPFRQQLPNAEPMNDKDKTIYLKHIEPLRKELDSVIKVKFKK